MITLLKSFLHKEQFRPSIAGLFLNPFYFARKAIYNSIKKNSQYINGRTLDIGCGSKPYADLFRTEEYIGMDVESSAHNHGTSLVDVFYDGNTIPFNKEHFDSVVCFEVLELIFNAESFLNEANRILKPGGKAIFTVPFIWDEHEQPNDYARYSSFGLAHLFKKSGFHVIRNEKYLGDLRLMALLTNAYIYKVIRRYIPSKISFILILPLTTLINITGHIFYLLPKNPDMYFGNLFVLEKPKPE